MNIFMVSVQGDLHCFVDDLSKEQISKCYELADKYRKDRKKHTLEEYKRELDYRYSIVLHKAPISFCVGF